MDRDVGAGEEAPLLVRVPVHGELQKIRANAAIVQKGVSLARRSVSSHALAFAPQPDEQLQQRALRLDHLLGKCGVGFHPVQTRAELTVPQVHHGWRHGFGTVFGMPQIDPDRASVCGDFIDVEKNEAVRRENLFHAH